MAFFAFKTWCDQHVLPLLAGAEFLSELHHGVPPKEVLVFARAKKAKEWAQIAKRLLDQGFAFDYTREAAMVNVGGQTVMIFGGDGAPFFNKSGMALVRLVRQMPLAVTGGVKTIAGKKVKPRVRDADGEDEPSKRSTTSLILDLGGKFESPLAAAAAIKEFFGLFDEESPMAVCAKYKPAFGA